MESFSNNERPNPKIKIEIAAEGRPEIEVEVVESGPLNEFGVPAWHKFKSSAGHILRAEWRELHGKYVAEVID